MKTVCANIPIPIVLVAMGTSWSSSREGSFNCCPLFCAESLEVTSFFLLMYLPTM